MSLKFTCFNGYQKFSWRTAIWALAHGTSEDRKFIVAREETLLVLDAWVVFFF